jgi:hypothetical protein
VTPPANTVVVPAAPIAPPQRTEPQATLPPKPRPAAVRAKPKPAAKPAAPLPVPRDSAPMPRGGSLAAAELLDSGRLALAGAALLIVALGGAVVLGVGRRALLEAQA